MRPWQQRPRSLENGNGVIRTSERTATDVTRIREWRDGVPAEVGSQVGYKRVLPKSPEC